MKIKPTRVQTQTVSHLLMGIISIAIICASQAALAEAPAPEKKPIRHESASAIAWDNLNPKQQAFIQQRLKNDHKKWSDIPASRQQKIIEGLNRWMDMSPEQKNKAKNRYQRWHDLSPKEKQKLRAHFHDFKKLSPEQQARLKKRRQWFQNLPDDKRQQLRSRWKNMDPAQRKQFRKMRAHDNRPAHHKRSKNPHR